MIFPSFQLIYFIYIGDGDCTWNNRQVIEKYCSRVTIGISKWKK